MLVEGNTKDNSVKLFGPVVKEDMFFLSGALAALLFSGVDYLCNFGRGYYERQFCEIILNLGLWFRRRSRLKEFLSGALAASYSVERNYYAILQEGIMGNIHVKLYEIWTSGSGDVF